MAVVRSIVQTAGAKLMASCQSADCKIRPAGSVAHLDVLVSNTHMVNHSPLDSKSWQTICSAPLSQYVQAGICIAIVGLPCGLHNTGISIYGHE